MIKYQFGNFETEFDPTDVEFVKRYEDVSARYREKMQAVPDGKKLSETLERVCEIFADTLNELFGDGASEAMFGETKSVELCVNAYQTFAKAMNGYKDILKNIQPTTESKPKKTRKK